MRSYSAGEIQGGDSNVIESLLDVTKRFALVSSDALSILRKSNTIIVEKDFDTHMTVSEAPNLISVFRFSDSKHPLANLCLVEEQEVESKQKLWRCVDENDLTKFVAERMDSYDDLWNGG
mmetsp:Transcript_6906/g.8353  ORF Transcript_6906/g.8353 Transcript_6906/m.8353 type:complete len:120 (-) Transcript_6906:410-769(-)|eukprot:CAMPEP_0184026266 /NCGR_PEP_ID=MMETSP0954-20121128/13398_1 /TAXON_ID=627963 /ORGANISM="Aplanochytrium sp, Strain PBS07" /LENGTH=119 /DNA_ID=CAMNT_0026310397 /DNA_START=438 /DNA_END=797 /DNA_ORIENTATION=+